MRKRKGFAPATEKLAFSRVFCIFSHTLILAEFVVQVYAGSGCEIAFPLIMLG